MELVILRPRSLPNPSLSSEVTVVVELNIESVREVCKNTIR